MLEDLPAAATKSQDMASLAPPVACTSSALAAQAPYPSSLIHIAALGTVCSAARSAQLPLPAHGSGKGGLLGMSTVESPSFAFFFFGLQWVRHSHGSPQSRVAEGHQHAPLAPCVQHVQHHAMACLTEGLSAFKTKHGCATRATPPIHLRRVDIDSSGDSAVPSCARARVRKLIVLLCCSTRTADRRESLRVSGALGSLVAFRDAASNRATALPPGASKHICMNSRSQSCATGCTSARRQPARTGLTCYRWSSHACAI